MRPLDRYVLSEFWKVLAATALGFPLLVIVIDISEKSDTYLARELSWGEIGMAYLYGIPDTMFQVLPAAVLFATVFTVGGFTRHSEITAAKASGISFHRFIAPIATGALFATFLGLGLGMFIPGFNARRLEILKEKQSRASSHRANFAYAAENGRVYKIGEANVVNSTMRDIEIERRGSGPDYPTYVVAAKLGQYRPDSGGWLLSNGVVHLMPDSLTNLSVRFDSLRDRQFVERPIHLMANPRAPAEMGFTELGRFITAMERSGADVRKLRVERMLKIAIPVTSVIIMLIGAPLATSTQRGGTAYGVAISLATTVIFLVLLQLTQAIGASGLVMPELAAWLPGTMFTFIGTYLLVKVRT
jgi:lipopolysaccharide export system permease protein